MARMDSRIDELDIELNGSSALKEHLERIRELQLTLCMEFEFAASEIRARLEQVEPKGVDQRRFEDINKTYRRSAREVADGYKRMAEMSIAIAQLTGKTWLKFVQNYLPDPRQGDNRAQFDINS